MTGADEITDAELDELVGERAYLCGWFFVLPGGRDAAEWYCECGQTPCKNEREKEFPARRGGRLPR